MEQNLTEFFKKGLAAGRDQIAQEDEDKYSANRILDEIGNVLIRVKSGLTKEANIDRVGNTITITRSDAITRMIVIKATSTSISLISFMNDDDKEVEVTKAHIDKENEINDLVEQLGAEVIYFNEKRNSKIPIT